MSILAIGKIRAISFGGNGMNFPNTNAIKATDRPRQIVRVPAVSQSDSGAYWVSIGTDGTITLYQGGSTVTLKNYVMFSAVYAVND